MFVHVGHDIRILILLGLFCVGYGGFIFYRGISAGSVASVDVREMEAGKKIDRNWLSIRGVPRWDLSLCGGGDDSHRRIVPVMSEDWSTGRPVAIFLEMSAKDVAPLDWKRQQEIRGTVVVGRTVGEEFATRFAVMDVRESENALLINPGRTPRDNIRDGEYWAMGGLGLLLVYRIIPRRWKPGLFELRPTLRGANDECVCSPCAYDSRGIAPLAD